MLIIQSGRLRIALRVITALSLAALVWWGAYITDEANRPAAFISQGHQPKHKLEHPNQNKSHDNNDFYDATKVLAIAGAIIALFQCYIAARQTRMIGQQVEIYRRQEVLMSGQLTAAKTAADAALDQAITAKRALDANERAWLSVEISDWEHFSFQRNGGAEIYLTFLIKNFGKTPAINVHTSAKMFIDGEDAIGVAAWTSECRKVGTTNSRLLFPQQIYAREYGVGLRNLGHAKAGDWFMPIIFACVTYKVLPDLSVHQTLCCYHLSKADGLLRVGDSVLKGDLQITVASGGLAD